jgi:hypothetical protein
VAIRQQAYWIQLNFYTFTDRSTSTFYEAFIHHLPARTQHVMLCRLGKRLELGAKLGAS